MPSQKDVPLDGCSCCNCLHRTRLDAASSTWQTLLMLLKILEHKGPNRLCAQPCIAQQAAELSLQGLPARWEHPTGLHPACDHWKPHAQPVPLPVVFLGQRKRLPLTPWCLAGLLQPRNKPEAVCLACTEGTPHSVALCASLKAAAKSAAPLDVSGDCWLAHSCCRWESPILVSLHMSAEH